VDRVRAYFRIKGDVQGVGFRFYLLRQAAALKVGGWVRNLYDGDIEGEVEGPRHRVEEFLRYCWEGPPLARVEDVEVHYVEPIGEEDFKIKR